MMCDTSTGETYFFVDLDDEDCFCTGTGRSRPDEAGSTAGAPCGDGAFGDGAFGDGAFGDGAFGGAGAAFGEETCVGGAWTG